MPVFFFLMWGRNSAYADIPYGRGTVGANVMTGMALYGALVSTMSAGVAVSLERASGWSRQLRLTPLSPTAYIALKALAGMVTGAISVGAVYAVGLATGVRMPAELWLATGLVTWLGSAVFAAFGLFMGYLFVSDNAMKIIGPSMALMAFLGGLFMPLDQMADIVRARGAALAGVRPGGGRPGGPGRRGGRGLPRLHATARHRPHGRGHARDGWAGRDGRAAPGAARGEVLIVTTFGRPGFLKRAMASGANGFVVKDTPADELAEAVRRIMAGLRVVDPALAADSLVLGDSPLTPREAEVLQAAADGATVAVIARRVHLSEGTVRNHLSAAKGKTATGTRAEAVRVAVANGWVLG